jgi:hypothetical protein
MSSKDILQPSRGFIAGEVCGGYVYPEGETLFTSKAGDFVLPGKFDWLGKFNHNQVLYGWAKVVAEALRGSPDGKNYSLRTMYFEFENNGGAAVTPPTITRDAGKDYYDGLSTDANRDYLRVSVAGVTLSSTDEDNFPDGNKLSFIAQTSGSAGVHGKPFSAASDSRVYGGALVASPVLADPTQDIVFSRFYFSDSSEQLLKQAGSQITLTWPLTLN